MRARAAPMAGCTCRLHAALCLGSLLVNDPRFSGIARAVHAQNRVELSARWQHCCRQCRIILATKVSMSPHRRPYHVACSRRSIPGTSINRSSYARCSKCRLPMATYNHVRPRSRTHVTSSSSVGVENRSRRRRTTDIGRVMKRYHWQYSTVDADTDGYRCFRVDFTT